MMNKQLRLLRMTQKAGLCLAVFFGLISTAPGFSQWTNQVSGFSKPSYGIFSLSVVDANTAWGTAFDSIGFMTTQKNGYFSRYLNLFNRTTDAGVSWHPGRVNLSNPDSLVLDFIDGINKDTAWVTMLDTVKYGGGIYKTGDGGRTWALQNNAALPMFAAPWGYPDYIHFFNDSVGVCIGDSNGTGIGNSQPGTWEIYTTVNGGALWTRVAGDSIPANMLNEYAVDNSFASCGNSIWFGTSYGNIYKSDNRGAGWSVSSGNLAYNYVQSIAMDSLSGLATDGLNLSTTTDGGKTWAASGSYPPNTVSWLCYLPGSAGNKFISSSYGYPGYSGTSFSSDGGITWNTVDTLQHGAVAFFNSNTGWSGGFDSSLTKDGMFRWIGPTGMVLFALPENRSIIYPNPMCDKAVVQVQKAGAVQRDVTFILSNEWGSVVYSRTHINGDQLEIHRDGLAPGIYFYRLMNESEVIGSGKIVIR